jgi:hypothetical protein
MNDAEVGFVAAQPHVTGLAVGRELVLPPETEQLLAKPYRAGDIASVNDRKALRIPHTPGLLHPDRPRHPELEVEGANEVIWARLLEFHLQRVCASRLNER